MFYLTLQSVCAVPTTLEKVLYKEQIYHPQFWKLGSPKIIMANRFSFLVRAVSSRKRGALCLRRWKVEDAWGEPRSLAIPFLEYFTLTGA